MLSGYQVPINVDVQYLDRESRLKPCTYPLPLTSNQLMIPKRPKRWMRHKKLSDRVKTAPEYFSECASGCRSRCANGSPRINNSRRQSKCFKKKKLIKSSYTINLQSHHTTQIGIVALYRPAY